MRAFATLMVVTSIILLSSRALAEETVLSLTASGLIIRPPHWEDAANKTITSINFDFSGAADLGQSNRDVDSQVAQAKLVDAQQANTRVALERPRQCRIGTNSIKDEHVHLLHNGNIHATDRRDLAIPAGILQTFALRFSKDGQYRNKSGAVSCERPGSLTYAY